MAKRSRTGAAFDQYLAQELRDPEFRTTYDKHLRKMRGGKILAKKSASKAMPMKQHMMPDMPPKGMPKGHKHK